jgi:hypothetical protein
VYGNVATATKHPDARAIFYEDFSKKKIENLLSLLNGFKDSLKVVKLFNMIWDHECSSHDCDSEYCSKLLQQITSTKNDCPLGQYPELKPLLEFFEVCAIIL